jgi:hypothetical protein
MMAVFTQQQRQQARYWLPPLLAGGAAWLAFTLAGGTPLIRASGLALVVVGMALALRPFGAALAFTGSLAMAFSPSFWTQMGGAESLDPGQVALALGAAIIVGGVAFVLLGKRPFTGAVIGLLLFAGLFLTTFGTPRSLRLTTLVTAWTLLLLVESLFVSNPRPDEPPTGKLMAYHAPGLLVLLAIGVLNDPLVTLLAPAVALGLFLSRKRLPLWYWAIFAVVAAIGVSGIIDNYISSFWWNYPPDQADALHRHIPFLLGDAWREPSRWLRLISLVVSQFSVIGLALGVLGLARLSRWYPPVGVVTMIAYGTYALFGLIYFGEDSPVLLLPLLMIQVFWMTYAVYTFSQWLKKSLGMRGELAVWFAPAAFTLLPLVMLLRIVGVF